MMTTTSFSHCPFDPNAVRAGLGDDVSKFAFCEIPASEQKLTALVLARIAELQSDACHTPSFELGWENDRDADDNDDPFCTSESFPQPATEGQDGRPLTTCRGGLGLFALREAGIFVLHQTIGAPCGTSCGAQQLRTLVLFAALDAGGLATIRAFCDALVEEAEKADPKRYSIYRWHLKYRYWRHDSRVVSRPLASIILPSKLKKDIVDDVEDFLSPKTRAFYLDHGIPYRRGYLFHGTPGAGKSSLIAGLASRFGRNVCYLPLCDQDMSDDALKDAVSSVPSRSIVVLEDIDSLFDKKRNKKNPAAPLTFSGLLNALDGVGKAGGQLFVMTTNEKENLDAALTRHGRVDLSVEFQPCVPEQAALMYASFYPDAPTDAADAFADRLFAGLASRDLSMAALQAYFVKLRTADAAEALASVARVVTDLDARDDAADSAPGRKAAAETTKRHRLVTTMGTILTTALSSRWLKRGSLFVTHALAAQMTASLLTSVIRGFVSSTRRALSLFF